jgi:hypothetical protein
MEFPHVGKKFHQKRRNASLSAGQYLYNSHKLLIMWFVEKKKAETDRMEGPKRSKILVKENPVFIQGPLRRDLKPFFRRVCDKLDYLLLLR